MKIEKMLRLFILSLGGAGVLALGEVNTAHAISFITNPATGNEYGLTDRAIWSDAQAVAQSLGGNLVTINDQAEQDWLVDQFQLNSTDSFWIGLNDEAQEGVYEWVSGETASYRNFALGQPDNQNNEDYFVLGWDRSDGWNDLRNIVRYSYIPGLVERSATPVPTPAPLLGLLGLGISTIRKQRKQSTAE